MHGLNTYDYGARQHDPILARWDRIDPLCEKYYNVSPYNYCLNNPIKLVDPDGKAPGPGDFFQTLDDAAKDFGLFYNDNSIRENREFCSTAFLVKNKNGDVGYSYSIANGGGEAGATLPKLQGNAKVVAYLHTHGAYMEKYNSDEFSGIRDDKGKLLTSNEKRKSEIQKRTYLT